MLLAAVAGSVLAQSSNQLIGQPSSKSPRIEYLLDQNWKFHLGDAASAAKDFGYGIGAAFAKSGGSYAVTQTSFDDSGWRNINVPHDWGIETPFVPNAPGDEVGHGSKSLGRNYSATTIGWYRRRFSLPKASDGNRFEIRFDGVFRNAEVWLNGHYLGRHEDGYTPFNFDVTDIVNYGGANEITVRVDASEQEGWWYEGAGIYRHVWLQQTSPIHVVDNGVFVTSAFPAANFSQVTVSAQTTVANDTGKPKLETLVTNITDPNGKEIGAISVPVSIPAYGSRTVEPKLTFKNPKLWSCDTPNLYRLSSELIDAGTLVDSVNNSFGVREIHFDVNKGLLINGKSVRIQGFCNHQDHAGVGIAVSDNLNAWRLQQLKNIGCNAIRCSHNPPDPAILDACDRMGILVMDETRLMESTPFGLDELQTLIRRDRNHPSVFLWSLGNEEWIASTEVGKREYLAMKRVTHELDPTRPTTWAANNGETFRGANEVVDVRGWNYIENHNVDKYHAEHPNQPQFGSEEASTLSTRGEYSNDPKKGYMAAYDINNPGWGGLAEQWIQFEDSRPWFAGAFVWTGFDYRGEPTPYGWPCISSHFGILDTCGFPKDLAYYYASVWKPQPMVHLLPHWNWDTLGKPIDVWAFTNGDKVELKLNGVIVASGPVKTHDHFEAKVPFQPGTLTAISYKNGKVIATDSVTTAGPVDHLTVTAVSKSASANGDDVIVYRIKAFDAKGNFCPTANNLVHFDISGPASIIGVGNGDPSCHEPDTFTAEPNNFPITEFRMHPEKFNSTPTPDASDRDLGELVTVTEANQLRQAQTSALFESTFTLSTDQSATLKTLTVGQVDDSGSVFLNGQLLGTTSEWNRSYSFDIAGKLREGANKVSVWVNNASGWGGVSSVSLSGPAPEPQFSRSLFNGLAEVIVRVHHDPGTVTLDANAEGLPVATGSAPVAKNDGRFVELP